MGNTTKGPHRSALRTPGRAVKAGQALDMTLRRGWVKTDAAFIMAAMTEPRRCGMEEDEGPVRKRSRLERIRLDTLGIEELRDYIGELREEIARVEADIGRKQGHRSAADAFFRKPGSG